MIEPLPPTDELLALAKRCVWFEAPELALQQPARLAAYVMAKGAPRDWKVLRAHWSQAQMQAALRAAPPGIHSGRSWHYWHLMLDMGPPPPLPQRQLPGLDRGAATTSCAAGGR